MYLMLHAGNRCHLQTKEQNIYLTLIYDQQLKLLEEGQYDNDIHCEYPCEHFPNAVFLSISNAPWEEYPQRREPM